MDKKAFVFIGRSGSGKGTQGELLMEYVEKNFPNDPYFFSETGSGFRDFVTHDRHSHKLAKNIMDAGGRQPDFLAVWVWASVFIDKIKGDETFLFIDGTPRSEHEAMILDTALNFYEFKNVYILYVDISNEEAIKRLKLRGRKDDKTDEEINKRLAWFEKDVIPAVEYYKKSDKVNFLNIDGERSIEEIHIDIVGRIFS